MVDLSASEYNCWRCDAARRPAEAAAAPYQNYANSSENQFSFSNTAISYKPELTDKINCLASRNFKAPVGLDYW